MEIWILVLLILLSGFFAMSEMSIGASRLAILTQMAEGGNEGARIAAELRGVFGESMWVPRIEAAIDNYAVWLAFAKYPPRPIGPTIPND